MSVGMINIYWWLVVLLFGLPVQAATVYITGEYKPAVYDAGGGKFINTTPCSDATSMRPQWCNGSKPTIDNPQALVIPLTINRSVINGNDVRSGITYQAFPGARDITLSSVGSGRSYNVRFILTDIGARVSPDIFGSAMEPGTNKRSIAGACNSGSIWGNSMLVDYFYRIESSKQISGGQCYNNFFKHGFSSQYAVIDRLYLGYKLEAPDPLKIPNGVYRGSLTLSLGENGELNLGFGKYTDNQVTFIITLTVQHQIKADFPPGSDKALLLPPGGWDNWVYVGKNRIPPLLSAGLKTTLSYSSNLKIMMRCEYENGDECAIKNSGDGHLAALRVYILRIGGDFLTTKKPLIFSPPPSNAYASIWFYFTVDDRQVLNEMMNHPGGKYKGKVTIIFDATI